MFLSTFRFLKGYVKVKITGYSPERFINACKYRNIRLWELTSVKGQYGMCVSIKDFKKLKPVIRKTGTKITIVERFGLPFFIYKYKNRKIFLLGFAGCLITIYILSLFIWNIKISGNTYRTDEMMLNYLKEEQIKCGNLKSNVNCFNIAKNIRKDFDEITWVSVSLDGCCLNIRVKENELVEADTVTATLKQGTDLVAEKDGIITEIITRKGMPLVEAGDKVEEGDVLVSGYVSIYNDNKEIVGYQTENSQADIKAQCLYLYKDKIEKNHFEKEYVSPQTYSLYIRIDEYVINIGRKINKKDNSEILSTEKQLRIHDSFYLPIYIGKQICKKYTTKKNVYEEKTLKNLLTANIQKTCKELEKKGVEIIQNNVKIYNDRNSAMAEGTLTIICDIGEERESIIPELPMEEVLNGND